MGVGRSDVCCTTRLILLLRTLQGCRSAASGVALDKNVYALLIAADVTGAAPLPAPWVVSVQ